MTYGIIFLSILLGAFAQITMKFGANSATGLSLFMNPYVIAGLGMYGLSAVLWIYTLPKVQLSLAYPMVSAGYVLVFTLAHFLFKEPINSLRLAGLVVIVTGVLMISKS